MIDKNIISGIYKITSPTGKIYIGKSINIKDRFHRYYRISRCKDQKLLYNSLVKHGYNEHKFEIIHIVDCENLDKKQIRADLNILEKHYILKYNSFVGNNKNGLNLTTGGDSYEVSEITREKQRESNKGEKNGFYGRKHTEETKNIMRKPKSEQGKINIRKSKIGTNKGEKNPNYGKKWSDEQRLRLSEKKKGIKSSESSKIKRSLSMKGRKQSREHIIKRFKSIIGKGIVPISAISPDGILMEFKGAIELKNKFGLNPVNITACLKGRQKNTGGWSNFKYL